MPPQNGLRLHHLDRTNKARPKPGHPYEQRAIATAQSKTRWCPPQSDGKLMAEKQILSFKPAPRLEQVATNIPRSYNANLGRMEFSERTRLREYSVSPFKEVAKCSQRLKTVADDLSNREHGHS
jgi:hypothetical protein